MRGTTHGVRRWRVLRFPEQLLPCRLLSSPDGAHSYCRSLNLPGGGQLAEYKTALQAQALRTLIWQNSASGRCIRVGPIKVSGSWRWRDGSAVMAEEVRENSGGTEMCSCWYYDDSITYDAPCGSFGSRDGLCLLDGCSACIYFRARPSLVGGRTRRLPISR